MERNEIELHLTAEYEAFLKELDRMRRKITDRSDQLMDHLDSKTVNAIMETEDVLLRTIELMKGEKDNLHEQLDDVFGTEMEIIAERTQDAA